MRLILSTIFIFIVISQVVHAINLKLDPHLEVVKNENGVITLGLKHEAKPQTQTQHQTQPKQLQWQQIFGLMPSTSLTQMPKLLFKPEVERTQKTVPNASQVIEPAVVPSSVQGSDRAPKAGNTETKETESAIMPKTGNDVNQNSVLVPKTDKNVVQISGENPTTIMGNAMSIDGNNGVQKIEKAQPQKSANGNEPMGDLSVSDVGKQVGNMDNQVLKDDNDASKIDKTANQGMPVNNQIAIGNQGMSNGPVQEIGNVVNQEVGKVANQGMPVNNQIAISNQGMINGPVQETSNIANQGMSNGFNQAIGEVVNQGVGNSPVQEIGNNVNQEMPVNNQIAIGNQGMSNGPVQEIGNFVNQGMPVNNQIVMGNQEMSNGLNQGIGNGPVQEIGNVFSQGMSMNSQMPMANQGMSANDPKSMSNERMLSERNQVPPAVNPTLIGKNGMIINPLLQLLSQSLVISSLVSKSSSEAHSLAKSESNLDTPQSIQPQFTLETLLPSLTQLHSMKPIPGKTDATQMIEPVFQPQSRFQTQQLPSLQLQSQTKPDAGLQLLPLLLASILKSSSINAILKQESSLIPQLSTQPKFPLEPQISSVMQMQPKIRDNTNFAVSSTKTPASVINPILPPALKVITQLRQLICYGVTRNAVLNSNGAFKNGLSRLCGENFPAPKVASQVDLIRSLLLRRLQKFT